MLNVDELKKYYPNLQGFERSILREYLQYKILNIIFKSDFGKKLSFLGGTAIKICYNGFRFSEDLDFDNFKLTKDDFEKMSVIIKNGLELEGYEIEIKNIYKGAFHSHIKFLNILYDNKLSPMQGEKMFIQVDTVPHNFKYNPNNFLLSKFDVFRNIKVTPIDVILSQKIAAIFGRRRPKGRDFYDILFLNEKTDFNFDYLDFKLGIKDKEKLKKEVLKRTKNLNFNNLARDVMPFLINPEDSERILSFREYIEQKL